MRTYQKNYRIILRNIKNNKHTKDFKKVKKTIKKVMSTLSNTLGISVLEDIDASINTQGKFLLYIKHKIKNNMELLGIKCNSCGTLTSEYWAARGWGEDKIYNYLKKQKIGKKKRLSPFDYKFWMKKYNMTEEDAKYKANSIRPIRKEYWVEKGYSIDEAIHKAKEYKNNNNSKGSKNSIRNKKENPEKYIGLNSTSIFYYLNRGYNEKEAKEKLKERQSTFSLKKCIEKYGDEEGLNIFNKRQKNWQDTLNSKSEKEINEINSKKNIYIKKANETGEEYFNRIKGSIDFNGTTEDYINDYINKYKNSLYYKSFVSPEEYYYKASGIYRKIINKQRHLEIISKYYEPDTAIKTKIGIIRKVSEGTLRSNHEFLFYRLLKENDINFELEKVYKNTNMRCDFFLIDTNEYIEIAGMSGIEEYDTKMEYKRNTFGSIILKPKEIINFAKGKKWNLI